MAIMGKYCKAYPLQRLRRFPGWSAYSQPGDALQALGDDDYVFVQDNFVVTAGIFSGQSVIFDQVTPAWREFCKSELNFEVPDSIEAGQAG